MREKDDNHYPQEQRQLYYCRCCCCSITCVDYRGELSKTEDIAPPTIRILRIPHVFHIIHASYITLYIRYVCAARIITLQITRKTYYIMRTHVELLQCIWNACRAFKYAWFPLLTHNIYECGQPACYGHVYKNPMRAGGGRAESVHPINCVYTDSLPPALHGQGSFTGGTRRVEVAATLLVKVMLTQVLRVRSSIVVKRPDPWLLATHVYTRIYIVHALRKPSSSQPTPNRSTVSD